MRRVGVSLPPKAWRCPVEGLECRRMAKSPKGIVVNHEEMTIQVGTRSVTGTYSVWAGMITVSTPLGNTTAQIGESESPRALQGLARKMLRELAIEGKA
jgi:hypothetical protein